MKVSPLHNLIKKQCLITLTSPFFVVIGYAHEWILESTLLVSMLLKNQIIFSFLFCPSYFFWNCFCNYFGFSSLSEIITNCLMSYFLISLFFWLWGNWLCVENLMKLSTLKKHIPYISMIGHSYTDMKVSSLHNLMKKQSLI